MKVDISKASATRALGIQNSYNGSFNLNVKDEPPPLLGLHMSYVLILTTTSIKSQIHLNPSLLKNMYCIEC